MTKIEGRDGFLVVKSMLIHEAVANGYYQARWVDGNEKDVSGGYYMLSKCPELLQETPFLHGAVRAPEAIVL
jgi:hypothetical protein